MSIALLPLRQKCERLIWKLNSDAYAKQTKGRKTPLKTFHPCAKSLEILKVLNEGEHFGMAMAKANRIKCGCHNELSEKDLWNIVFTPSSVDEWYQNTGKENEND